MISTLQGKFVEYEASYKHVNSLGVETSSLIDDIEIHQLLHPVRVIAPTDDGRPDFLVNDNPDPENSPAKLYASDGSTVVVSQITGGQYPGHHRRRQPERRADRNRTLDRIRLHPDRRSRTGPAAPARAPLRRQPGAALRQRLDHRADDPPRGTGPVPPGARPHLRQGQRRPLHAGLRRRDARALGLRAARARRRRVQRRQPLHHPRRLQRRGLHRRRRPRLSGARSVPRRRHLQPGHRPLQRGAEGERDAVQRQQRLHGRRHLPGGHLRGRSVPDLPGRRLPRRRRLRSVARPLQQRPAAGRDVLRRRRRLHPHRFVPGRHLRRRQSGGLLGRRRLPRRRV